MEHCDGLIDEAMYKYRLFLISHGQFTSRPENNTGVNQCVSISGRSGTCTVHVQMSTSFSYWNCMTDLRTILSTVHEA